MRGHELGVIWFHMMDDRRQRVVGEALTKMEEPTMAANSLAGNG